MTCPVTCATAFEADIRPIIAEKFSIPLSFGSVKFLRCQRRRARSRERERERERERSLLRGAGLWVIPCPRRGAGLDESGLFA